MRLNKSVTALPPSPTLAANQRAGELRAAGREVLHMGFGQAPFPVHPKLARALAEEATANRYDSIAGLAELRAEAGSYFAERSGLAADDYQVMVAPGSKLLLFALAMAIEGDTVLPMPSWVSYEPQIAMLGSRSIWVPA